MTFSSRSHRTGFVSALVLFAAGVIGAGAARSMPPQAPGGGSALSQTASPAEASRGVEIVMHGGYPELRFNGVPFFIHSAAFFYYRVPRDLWEVSLERYRGLGINTIDIYIPWNWHELADGEFDFDGHTNSRRDLRGLLKLLANKNLKLIARPGPLILNEWRLGGYPEWLLGRADFQAAMPAEFRMDEIDLLEGRYPPLAELNSRDAEAAALAWLANPLHMDYSRKWLEAVGRELAPYAAVSAASAAPATAADAKGLPAAPPSEPLLFVQLEDDVANGRKNRAGTAVWRYLESLRAALRDGGLHVPVFINPTDARVAAAGSGLADPIGVMGQWYLHPEASAGAGAGKDLQLTAEDASTIELFAEELKTQPGFPPALIEYQAGWYAPGDDDRPLESAAENTLDSSRLFLAHGLHGLSYFPLQDSVTPAGWSVPWANQNSLWNAALDPNGRSRRRADAIARNGDILMRWGPQLAASHKRADFGVVYPLGAYDQNALTADDIHRVSEGVQKIERLAQLEHFSSELLDPEYQPVEQLLRDPMILLPVFDRAAGDSSGDASALQLSEKSQRALVEYVRGGGTLFVFPKRPAGDVIAELWKDVPETNAEAADIVSVRRGVGDGHVIESSKDFFSWINLKQSYEENRQAESADWNLRAVRRIITQAGVHPAIIVLGDPVQASSLVVTELISNEGTGTLGARTAGHGWLSVTNLNTEDAIDASVSVLMTTASALNESPERVTLEISVPARESLLLPLGLSLCLEDAPPGCSDEAIISGAELVSAAREGKTLEIVFYAPTRAEIRLRLEQAPSHVEVEDTSPETKWSQERHEVVLATSRGAAPGYLRKLKVQLPYVPHVPALKRESDRGRGWTEMSVVNALRLPLGPLTNLGTSPPLIVIDDLRAARVTFEASNSDHDFHGDIDVNLTGAYKGSANLRILNGQIAVDTTKLKPMTADDPSRGASGGNTLDENGLLHGSIEAREGHDRKHSAIFYVPLRADATTAYRYDFDDDGALEWVLENSNLRLIMSPASGGRALALVDKSTGFDVLSSVGALRDGFSFTPNPQGIAPERARGRYGFFNRVYDADWVPDDKNTAMTLRHHAADAFPYGANIEKRVEVAGDVVSVSYRVSLDAAGAAASDKDATATAAPADQTQSFVATQSVPALDERGRLTKFCWSSASGKDAAAPPAKGSGADEAHCEDFAPGGAAIEIPADANHLEVRTSGRPGLAMDWDSGRMTIEPKRYSALVELRSAALKPGEEMHAKLLFRVLAPE